MLLNIIETNLQIGGSTEPFIDIYNGIIEYRFKFPVSLSVIKLDLRSIFNDEDFENYKYYIYYRLNENTNNPKQFIRLEDVSNNIYDEVEGLTNITDLIIENNGYVEMKAKYTIGCKVFGCKVELV